MNIKNLNQAIVLIAEKKEEIANYVETDFAYEILKNEIDQLSDYLRKNYGPVLDEALFGIYDEFCPDNEIKDYQEYITQDYTVKQLINAVEVEADDIPGIHATLALVPNPARFVLTSHDLNFQEVVWTSYAMSEA